MSIDLSVRKHMVSRDRKFELDVQFKSAAKRIALFGPSGAGKSLTLRAVAGLLRPDAGRIEVNGRVLFDSQTSICLPARTRRVAYLFQDYALFPHLTVAQNIAFGLRRGWLNPPRREVTREARRWVDAFELGAIVGSYPHEISGGQKQRVALARALMLQPDILLLDEPFSALDSQLRGKMRQELDALQRQLDVPMLLITHDPADVEALADEVFEVREGRVGRHDENVGL
ncbi:ATP-binding cassette domain-containing protein [Achromobacter sp. Root170]|uniref:ATP-binding cassette domain-containing protein n=1 Tax=Achromobacter sp. Root170 TaxID=1736480 RepID=UPI0006F3A48D|nr:ATP-binding cassette domain-containing protein [Achromobacter sp. Root170]KRB12092.1 ABC transporter ATP-binding protein [Achromobacter sp. Root170]